MQPNYLKRKGIYKEVPLTQHPQNHFIIPMTRKQFETKYNCTYHHIRRFALNKWIIIDSHSKLLIEVLCEEEIKEYLGITDKG